MSSALEIPVSLKRENDNIELRMLQPARYAQKLIRVREDGTKVYMYEVVEESHYINEDGTKQYVGRNGGSQLKWSSSSYVPKIKRRDIHTTIDKAIFSAIDNLKHAKKRVVIAEVRRVMLADEKLADMLPKNLGTSISRRIGHLVDKRNLAYEQQTKARRVLVKGKYRYVG